MFTSKTLAVNEILDTSFPESDDLRNHPKSVEILHYLSNKLDPERLDHVISVQETAVALAQYHNADVWKVNLAALLHDVAKWMSNEQLYKAVSRFEIELDPIEKIMPALLHAIVGVRNAIELFKVTDLDILEAIRCHTTGSASMGLTAKLIYVADFAEPNREYKEAEQVRQLAEVDLIRATHLVARYKIDFLLQNGGIIHPNTIHTYNSTFPDIDSNRKGRGNRHIR